MSVTGEGGAKGKLMYSLCDQSHRNASPFFSYGTVQLHAPPSYRVSCFVSGFKKLKYCEEQSCCVSSINTHDGSLCTQAHSTGASCCFAQSFSDQEKSGCCFAFSEKVKGVSSIAQAPTLLTFKSSVWGLLY